MGCHFLLQGIFPTQGSNLGFLHFRQSLYHLSHQGKPQLSVREVSFACAVNCKCLFLICSLSFDIL